MSTTSCTELHAFHMQEGRGQRGAGEHRAPGRCQWEMGDSGVLYFRVHSQSIGSVPSPLPHDGTTWVCWVGEGIVGLLWPLKSLSRRQEAPNRSPAAMPRAGDGSSQHPSERVLPTLPGAAGPSAFSCFPSGWSSSMLGTPHSGGPEPPWFLST